MEDTKQLTLMGNETPEQAEAIGLHYEIVSAAQAAASSLLDLGRKLKRMEQDGIQTENKMGAGNRRRGANRWRAQRKKRF